MIARWSLVVADFVREYHLTFQQVALMGSDDFTLLLQGLSDRSRFRAALEARPKRLHDPADIAAVHAAARR